MKARAPPWNPALSNEARQTVNKPRLSPWSLSVANAVVKASRQSSYRCVKSPLSILQYIALALLTSFSLSYGARPVARAKFIPRPFSLFVPRNVGTEAVKVPRQGLLFCGSRNVFCLALEASVHITDDEVPLSLFQSSLTKGR